MFGRREMSPLIGIKHRASLKKDVRKAIAILSPLMVFLSGTLFALQRTDPEILAHTLGVPDKTSLVNYYQMKSTSFNILRCFDLTDINFT